MAFGELGTAKRIMMNAPKYKEIIEPFGNNGSVAFYPGKRKPKSHIVNYENVDLFNIMTFIKGVTPADKKNLRGKDWIGNPETFETVLKINAIDGLEFFYKFFYLKHFTMKIKDKEAPPTFDYLKFGKDVKSLLFSLPQQKGFLKNVTLLNELPDGLISKGSGDSFTILVPKSQDQIESINSKLNSISGYYFYSIKSNSNDELFETVKSNPDLIVSTSAASTIMMAQMQEVTNYKSRIQ